MYECRRDKYVLILRAGGFEMFKLKKSLHILPVLAMVLVLAFGMIPAAAGAADRRWPAETGPSVRVRISDSAGSPYGRREAADNRRSP